VPRPVPVRGVIEGFYGPPWSHAARLDLVAFVAERAMNAYVYAPKSDPRHRDRWRDAYEPAEAAQLAALAAACADAGVRFGFAISPGLDVDYRDARDRQILVAKLAPLLDGGVDWVVLALDDIANRPGLAVEQAELATWLASTLPAVRLTLVPTEYVGTHPSPYLAELAAGVPATVELMWTGPTVCSPVIDATAAKGWRAAIGDHPLVLWDNYPVNDTVMEAELHLGPYTGRAAGLTDELDGVLCNPMLQPHASKVALATAAEFLRDPAAYEPAAAWARAIDDVGGVRAEALGALARACADGPLVRSEHLVLHRLVADLEREAPTPDWPDGVARVRAELAALRAAGDAFEPDEPLGDEIRPWLDQAAREADAGLAALRLVQQVRPVATRDGSGAGRAVAPDPDAAMLHAFALLFAWMGARHGAPVVAGPRFALHAAIVQLPGGQPALDIDLALREDCSAIDRLCRVALGEYRAWVSEADAGLDVRAGLEVVHLDADGTFSADADTTVLVRCGSRSTLVRASSVLPFRDARFS
jgi:hyaluronoglucosaminidase